MMEAVRTPETSVCLHDTTRRYIPAGYNLHYRRRENLKYHNVFRLAMDMGVSRRLLTAGSCPSKSNWDLS